MIVDEVGALKRELRGVQEMLALVLHKIGEPVTVSKEMLHRGLPEGASISIQDDIERDQFVFRLEYDEQQ